MLAAPVGAPGAASCGKGQDPVEWNFLQCFGERTPGEEVQEGELPRASRQTPSVAARAPRGAVRACIPDTRHQSWPGTRSWLRWRAGGRASLCHPRAVWTHGGEGRSEREREKEGSVWATRPLVLLFFSASSLPPLPNLLSC